MSCRSALLVAALSWALAPGRAGADAAVPLVGARAVAMAGAYTAVVDDATAFQWNPAALVEGPLLRATVHGGGAFADAGGLVDALRVEGGRGRRFLTTERYFGLSAETILFGIAVTSRSEGRFLLEDDRLRETAVELVDVALSFAQSLPVDGLTLGWSLHVLRGSVSERIEPKGLVPPEARTVAELHRRATSIDGAPRTALDVDLGLLYAPTERVRLGLMTRSLLEARLAADDSVPAATERHLRVGGAFVPRPSWVVGVDVDVTRRGEALLGEGFREIAVGVEKRFADRIALRAGWRAEAGGPAPTRGGLAGGLAASVRGFELAVSVAAATARRRGALSVAVSFGR